LSKSESNTKSLSLDRTNFALNNKPLQKVNLVGFYPFKFYEIADYIAENYFSE